MHLFRASLISAFLTLALVGAARGDSLVSGEANQVSREAKQKRDESDCRRWATLHTDFDPKHTTSSEAPDPHQTVPRLNRASGIPGHALADSAQRDAERRRSATMARMRQQAQEEADLEGRRAAYQRAVKTCLEGRNHSVHESGRR